MAVRRKYPGFALYMQKGAVKMRNEKKIAGCGGETAVILPTSSPRRVTRGLLAGIVPAIPRERGTWLQMSSALDW